MRLLSLLSISLLIGLSCTRAPGPIVTEERTVADFTKLHNTTSADVVMVENAGYDIQIEAPENLMAYLKLRVENGELEIDERRNNIRHSSRVTIYINQRPLEGLKNSGSGDMENCLLEAPSAEITISGSGDVAGIAEANRVDVTVSGSGDGFFELYTDQLKTSLSGSGDFEAEGSGQLLDLRISGSGDYLGRHFACQEADIRLSGSGNAEVRAAQRVDVTISGSGDLLLWGNPPQIITTITGSGEVHLR